MNKSAEPQAAEEFRGIRGFVAKLMLKSRPAQELIALLEEHDSQIRSEASARIAGLEEGIRELLRFKDIKDKADRMEATEAECVDYFANKEKAWANLRALLSSPTLVEGPKEQVLGVGEASEEAARSDCQDSDRGQAQAEASPKGGR